MTQIRKFYYFLPYLKAYINSIYIITEGHVMDQNFFKEIKLLDEAWKAVFQFNAIYFYKN